MTKEELCRRFGPKLIDALTQVMLGEVNDIRVLLNLSPRTGQQVVDTIANKLEKIPDYNWMKKV